MKQLSKLFLIGCLTTIVFSFGNISWFPPKTYTVTLSLDEWRSVLQVIDTSSKLLNKSDLPAKEVVFANSGLAQINQAIQFQVSAQLQAEAKKDSTNAVKPKTK